MLQLSSAQLAHRPREIRLGIGLLLLTWLILSPISLFIDYDYIQYSMQAADWSIGQFLAVMGVGLALVLALMYLIDAGQNWARWTLAVPSILGLLPMLAQWPSVFERSPLLASNQALQLLCQLAAWYCLFSPRSSAWYRQIAPIKPTDLAQAIHAAPRLQWISITAWLIVAISVIGLCILAGLSYLFISIGDDQYDTEFMLMVLNAMFDKQIPYSLIWIYQHAAILLIVSSVACVLQLITGLGLFYRKNWARLSTIAFVVGHIALSILAGIGLQSLFSRLMQLGLTQLEGAELAMAQEGMKSMWIGNLTINLIMLAPLVFLIWRLLAAEVRREFI